MPWYNWFLSERMKKSICAYLIQRYLGQFFEEKLTSDQLSVDLYNGTGSVEKIILDVQALNELSEKQNWPLEFVDGFVDKLQISIPWMTILKDPSFVEVSGLKITVQPKQQNEFATSMFESMWSSMTSSLKLAEEYARQEPSLNTDEAPYEGLELFAKTIDSVLSRVKVKFINTVIQVEHVPKDSLIGVGIVINIDLIEYHDEAGTDPSKQNLDEDGSSSKKAYVVQTFTTKNFNIEGVTVSTVEFPSKARTFSRSMMSSFSPEFNEESIPTLMNVIETSQDKPEVSKSHRADTPTGKQSDMGNLRQTILFAKLANKQTIKVHMKQSVDIIAPKVSIEVNLGHLVLFLSPRQVHALLELASGLASPDCGDHSNVIRKTRCVEKPMTAIDYQRVESELQQQLRPLHIQAAGLQGIHGWSGAALDDSDTEETFFPMKNSASGMYDSTMSGLSGSMESSQTSSAPSTVFTENTSRTRRTAGGYAVDVDPMAEISHFQVRCASLGVILLHEDLLDLSIDGSTLVESSVVQMQQTAEGFFDNLGDFSFLDSLETDFEQLSLKLDKSCRLNNIRFVAIPIHFEGKEKTTLHSYSITASLDTSKLQLLECLFESSEDKLEAIPLLEFDEIQSSKSPFSVTFKHSQRRVRNSQHRNCPKTEISLHLGKCAIEFDITIIDRISALLNSPPICVIERNNLQSQRFGDEPISEATSKDSLTDLKLKSPCISLKIRFPLPDFRPPHDLNRIPWWKRHIRPDHLTLKCYNAIFGTSFHSSQTFSEYSFQCRGADIYYSETEKGTALHIAKIGQDEIYLGSMQDVLKHPRISIKFFPPIEELEAENQEDLMTQSTINPAFLMKSDCGPFTSKRYVFSSNTPHDKDPHDLEELVIPGDKEEIEQFMQSTIQSARLLIEVSLPSVKMQLISKHVYELIYNRVNNDLLLWESNAPKSQRKSVPYYEPYSSVLAESQNLFSACKSGVQYETDSDSEDISESEGAILFYSTYEKQKPQGADKQFVKQSNLVLSLQIGNGTLSCNAPVRDSSTNNVIPGQVGDFLVNVQDATVFLVNGYKGEPELGYVCVQVERAELKHCEMMPSINIRTNFFNDSEQSQHLHPTFYKSDRGTLAEVRKENSVRDMLTLACKIESTHETHHVKTVRIALGLDRATLRHRMCLEPNSWISQMLDFFNVNDYPIPGYKSKEVLTELHLHMWDCAIDYRPLHLPLRSVITLGTFSMTSHLTEKTNTSTLRFIAEECGLFISDKAPSKHGVPSNVPVDIKRDYVNVISLGLFELSLRITDKNSKTHPHIDMRASNDCVHIYTCSDSGRALMQLISYIATDGDLKLNENSSNTDSAYSSPKHHPSDQELVNVEQVQDISKLTKSQHQQVNQLLVEALEEPEVEPLQEEYVCEDSTSDARLFFFPDENQMIPNPGTCKPFPQVVRELGDISNQNRDEDSDDDFYFVDEETGLGLFPKNGVPEIKWLTSDPVRIVENHFFVPSGKKDLLQTPDDFPIPKYKYTLCKMNIVWHMFGGNDFNSTSVQKKEKNVNFSDEKLDSVFYSNTEHVTINKSYSKCKPTQQLHWKLRGGVNRNHKVLMELELNKVKFQHEIYPETTFHASRQVLLISELEIRDVLESSEFNKFLYQYTSEAKPKQSQAHMIVIKAIHIRPDKNLSREECCLQLSLLPLRFNIDQDSLKFLVNFFTELGHGPEDDTENVTPMSKHNTPTHQPPIMTVNIECEPKKEEESVVDDNLIFLDPDHFETKPKSPEEAIIVDDNHQPVFFRNVVFGPEVQIKIDYQGKHVELTDGSVAGVFISLVMGLGQLNCSELKLKGISYRHGLLGVDKLLAFLIQEWLGDIKKNQLPGLLSGVGPIYSFVQLFQGVKDLFWMPIEQYQKDGRIVRGIQRGANSFTTSTAMAALELTSRLIHLIQLTAETAYDMLSPGPSVRRISRSKGRKKRYNQPQDIREGVTNAYMLVKEGIGETAGNIVEVASHEHEQKGYSGAVGGVLRQIPPTILKPIIIASEATSNVLGGMKYQLIPDARNEANQKWRTKHD